ncbi:hypothetical protein [Actinosynnema pretiosum]|uniref:Secreted protein n=1 Tax=Actinosynnema pretiosum TaxID=42197 RepID=A0A290Z9I7_9PSEU|nr:hypothetical protein [Actinosynnema pretiosum]ATE55668.1 hypothetical protein CNX65_22230 [Actinosynnema pretiosum]
MNIVKRAVAVLGMVAALAVAVGHTAGAASGTDPVPVAAVTRVPAPEGVQVLDIDPAPLGEVGAQAEGGFDRDHYWVKISRTELVEVGAGAVCAVIVKGPLAGLLCPPLAAALNWAIGHFPVAKGFWAEVYLNGQVKIGAW